MSEPGAQCGADALTIGHYDDPFPVTIASNYAFRSEQAAMSRMDNFARFVDTSSGAIITFQLARETSNRTYPEIGVPDPHHPLSHHGNDPAQIAFDKHPAQVNSSCIDVADVHQSRATYQTCGALRGDA